MQTNKRILSEDELDAKIAEAMEASVRDEGMERGLRETIARLGAASPYMDPPEELRGKVLAATAPQTFRMEDYRKATRDNVRFYRWGMVAATLFLMAAAWYNLSMQKASNNFRTAAESKLKEAVTYISTVEGKLNALAASAAQKDEALKALVNPNVKQINLVGADKKSVGKLLVLDAESKSFMVVLPQEAIPPGAKVSFTVNSGGKEQKITAVAVGAEPFIYSKHVLPESVNEDAPVSVTGADGNVVAAGVLK